MRRSQLTWKSFILLLVALFASPLAFAQDGSEKPGPLSPPDALRLPVFKDLKLNKEQKAQIQQIQKNSQSDFDQKRETMLSTKRDFDSAMDGNADDATLRQKYQSFLQASDAFMNAGFEQAMAVRKVLTPKQRQKFRQLKNKMMERAPRDGQGRPPPPSDEDE